MKDIKEYIVENALYKKVNFNEQIFTMNQIIGSNVHHDIDKARTVNEITDDMWESLKKQGVKYILCFPPHYTQSDEKVDTFMIKMFIDKKKFANGYFNGEHFAIYNVNTHECVNKDIMEKGKAYKVIRFE